MRKYKRITFFFLFGLSLLFLTAGCKIGKTPISENHLKLSEYNIVWESPSKDHHGSMPIGNGDIGLNVWVEKNGDLSFYIGKTDAWEITAAC